jgi:hypothetical protein
VSAPPSDKRLSKRLVGRTIVAFELRPFQATDEAVTKRVEWATDPRIRLDDGTVVQFVTQETEIGEYGVRVVVSAKNASQAPAASGSAFADAVEALLTEIEWSASNASGVVGFCPSCRRSPRSRAAKSSR